MEAARMGFGAITLPHLGNGTRLPLKTKLSCFPLHLLQNNITLSRVSTKHNLCVKATSESSGDVGSSRPLPHVAPNLWGDHILSVPTENSEFDSLETEIESIIKPKVKNMLMSSHNTDKERILLIHLLMCLGTSHYFEKEIEEILDQDFENLDSLIADEDDLETTAIMFEVFRLYGHKISCDVFDRFKGVDGKFKEHLVSDVRGMLQLYEAAHLATPSDDILDEALSFTRYHLESLAGQEATAPHISRHILNELYKPRFLKLEIAAAREYISFYEKEEHDETLLKFGKLNFNFCKLHYVRELKTITKWWKDLDFAYKLPFSRDRLVETFAGVIAMFFEPRYALGRIVTTKASQIVTVMDDACDAYGTFSEVRSAIEELPSSFRIIIRSMMETMEDIEREMKPRGRSSSVQYLIEELKIYGEAYVELSKWSRSGHVPTFDEYIEVGIVSSGMRFLGIYEDDMRRGEVANGVNCYMKQHGVTKELAVSEIKKMIRDNYKIAMEEFLTTKGVPRPVLVRCLNMVRLLKLYYTEGSDGFTNPHGKLKDLITSLFFHPLPL
ncbi:Terpene synthase N-terminal domain [Arabidopsis suecica]|uniref:Terpene synthase N-terminal domain n=1 Tax=Arabidopsis suecica TaxID=45249 RepID=A0A8T2CLL7_ARASU|nr:Terpene synthase N-terminal domain [Arabidopsis suecica]